MPGKRYSAFRNQILAVLGSVSSVGACGGQAERDRNTTGSSTDSSSVITAGQNDTGASSGGVGGTAAAGTTAESTGATSTSTGGVAGAPPACGDEVRVEPLSGTCGDLPATVTVQEMIEPDRAAELCGCTSDAYQHQRVCLLLGGLGPSPCEPSLPPECVAELYACGLQVGASELCGPWREGAGDDVQCCYVLSGGCPIGRPFTVRGSARLPALHEAPHRLTVLELETRRLSRQTRAALVDAYSRDIQTEHASVASFARFVLQCLALGAPADIVHDAQRAMADELEHTRLAQRIALAFGARAVVPGPLDISGCMDSDQDLASVAETTAAESCIAETVSAMLLFEASQACRLSALKPLLATMAEDEARHALLGFRFVAWAIREGGDAVEQRVRRVFANAARHVGFGSVSSIAAPADELRAHGYLALVERHHIAQRVLREVVAPAAAALGNTALQQPRSRKPESQTPSG